MVRLYLTISNILAKVGWYLAPLSPSLAVKLAKVALFCSDKAMLIVLNRALSNPSVRKALEELAR